MLAVVCSCGANSPENTAIKTEPKQVITDFFVALTDDSKDSAQYCTDHIGSGGDSNIKDAKIINIKDDEGNKCRTAYSLNRGTITKHSDVICYEVTYDMQYVDENESSESSGTMTKWFTLIKETESSPWLIDEWGY